MGDRILRRPEVQHRTGRSKSDIYEGMERGLFPQSVPLSPNGGRVGWLESEIDQWIEARVAARDAALSAAGDGSAP